MNEYSEKIAALWKQHGSSFSTDSRVEFKNCFGAVAGYINGCIFISCGRFGVALRLPPEFIKNLFREKDVKHLKYFPRGHIKKEYAVLPERIIKNKSRFKKLLKESISYADRKTKIGLIHGRSM